MHWALILVASAVVAKYGVVYPPAELGHSSVDSRKLSISTTFPPGHDTIDPTIANKWTPRVPLMEENIRDDMLGYGCLYSSLY